MKTSSVVLSRRLLLAMLAVGALLAVSLLLQFPTLHGVKASVKTAVVAPCTAAFISASPTNPKPPGTTVTLNASAGGCGTPTFRYLLLAPGSTTWVFKTAYTASNTYSWVTTGAKAGVWQIGVWVRAVGSTARYQTWALGTYAIVFPYCTSAMFPTWSAFVVGTPPTDDVTIAPGATDCTSPLFAWQELIPGRTTWVTVQPYSSSGLHVILTSPKGAYRFLLLAKQTGSSHRYDTYAELTIWWLG